MTPVRPPDPDHLPSSLLPGPELAPPAAVTDLGPLLPPAAVEAVRDVLSQAAEGLTAAMELTGMSERRDELHHAGEFARGVMLTVRAVLLTEGGEL